MAVTLYVPKLPVPPRTQLRLLVPLEGSTLFRGRRTLPEQAPSAGSGQFPLRMYATHWSYVVPQLDRSTPLSAVVPCSAVPRVGLTLELRLSSRAVQVRKDEVRWPLFELELAVRPAPCVALYLYSTVTESATMVTMVTVTAIA